MTGLMHAVGTPKRCEGSATNAPKGYRTYQCAMRWIDFVTALKAAEFVIGMCVISELAHLLVNLDTLVVNI